MVKINNLLPLSSLLSFLYQVAAAGNRWHFVWNGTTGVIAIESIIVSDTLAILFDRAANDPLQVDGHTAWGALWNLETNTASGLGVKFLRFRGAPEQWHDDAKDGRMSLRIWEPCISPDGANYTLFEEPEALHLAETRWYPTALRIFDGSLIIIGGMHELTPFYNADPVNSLEFFPPKDEGVPRPMDFLTRTLPANLFPRALALPDGRIFISANNRTIIYDIEKNTEIQLPDIPNNVRVSKPFDAATTLLPLHPPHYIPEVLICGGSNKSDQTPSEQLSSQDPASDQCIRMALTPEGIKRGWEVERLLEPRMMGEMVLIPNGQVLIISGAQTGYPAGGSVGDPIGVSNADHPAFTPSIYTPDAPLGKRIGKEGIPTTDIARLYHSTGFMVSGSNPNDGIVNNTKYFSEFRVEYLNPPYMSVERPQMLNVPEKIPFNSKFKVDISIPPGLSKKDIKVALVDLGFSTHSFHQSSRLVFMDAQLLQDAKGLTIMSPPNNRVYPPGPGYIYVTIDDVTSPGVRVLMGNGLPPPIQDQGVRL